MANNSNWFVKFPGKFQKREDFITVADLIAKIPKTTFYVRTPSAADIKANRTYVVLVGEGMSIKVREACTPSLVTDAHTCFSVDYFGSRDWSITFDRFSDVGAVEIYASRGRPRKDLTRAQMRGERANGKKLSQIKDQLRLNSISAVSHYRGRGERP